VLKNFSNASVPEALDHIGSVTSNVTLIFYNNQSGIVISQNRVKLPPTMTSRTLSLSAALCFFACIHLPAQQAVNPSLTTNDETPVRTKHAMVVSVHHLATDAGVETLKEGGNAVDAAVATGFALAVVHPVAGNIGGGGFMLVRLANGQTDFIDFRESAPGKAQSCLSSPAWRRGADRR